MDVAGIPTYDAVVIGAGLAGLTAARVLHRLGYDVALLERGSAVGGRLRTDQHDGFLLDRGFALYNPAYPAGARTFDHAALQLQAFRPGVEVWRAGSWSRLSDPRREPRGIGSDAWHAARGGIAPAWELAAFGAYVAACGRQPVARLRRRPDVPLAVALREWGVGRRCIERLVGPFLSGVFGEAGLATSRRYADLVLRSFSRGVPSVPAAGMQALPEQIAADLPEGAVRTGVEVQSLRNGEARTADGSVTGRVIIVATEAPAAQRLLPGLAIAPMASLTTWYFAADAEPPHGGRTLLLDGSGSPLLSNVAVMTSAAATYSQSSRVLVAASAVGFHPDAVSAERARSATARLLGIAAGELTEVRRYPIAIALPQLRPGSPLRRSVEISDGLLVIGDHRDTPSIQGALVSGERGAAAAARMLGPVGSSARG